MCNIGYDELKKQLFINNWELLLCQNRVNRIN